MQASSFTWTGIVTGGEPDSTEYPCAIRPKEQPWAPTPTTQSPLDAAAGVSVSVQHRRELIRSFHPACERSG
jgi:hypothetical protein